MDGMIAARYLPAGLTGVLRTFHVPVTDMDDGDRLRPRPVPAAAARLG
jgi:hypothetical protein